MLPHLGGFGCVPESPQKVVCRCFRPTGRSSEQARRCREQTLIIGDCMRFVRVVLIASMYLCSANLHAQGASIHGKVLDSRTSEPIAKATVSIRDRKIETRTAATGEFELTDIEPGEMELYVTTVGYAL